MTDEKRYTISQIMSEFNRKRSTVRSYCEQGIFPNARLTTLPNGESYWEIPASDLQFMPPERKAGRPRKEDR